jgi:hypothetical protein
MDTPSAALAALGCAMFVTMMLAVLLDGDE